MSHDEPRRLLAIRRMVLLLCLPLFACSAMPEPSYYVLTEPDGQSPQDARALATASSREAECLDPALRVTPPFDGRALVYRTSSAPSEMGFYRTHRWAADPARLLTGVLEAKLLERGWVVAGDCERALVIRVLRLEEVDRTGQAYAQIEARAELGERSWHLEKEELATELEVAAVVDALSVAWTSLLDDLLRYVENTVREETTAP